VFSLGKDEILGAKERSLRVVALERFDVQLCVFPRQG